VVRHDLPGDGPQRNPNFRPKPDCRKKIGGDEYRVAIVPRQTVMVCELSFSVLLSTAVR
jgi:hypothetical protein